MPRQIVQVAVLRKSSSPDGAGGYSRSEAAIEGSPFDARVYRRPEVVTGFTADAPGETGADQSVIVSFLDPTAPILLNDIVVLTDGSRARVLRVRKYSRHVQCDVIVGVE